MSSLLLVVLAFVVDRDVPARMRDGTVLRAEIYRPSEPGRFPTLVYRTPYGRHRAPEDYTTVKAAAARGYAVVVQDVRGRYGSDGEFVPYRHEGRDGYDTIEWAAAQPWSDGRVGTFGLSYPGAVQWLAAVESPPHLEAMVPAMTFSTPRNFITSGGVFDMSWTSWIWENIAPDLRKRKDLPGPRSFSEAEQTWKTLRGPIEGRLPISDLPEFRDLAPYLFEWMKIPPGDARFDWMELRNKYDRVGAAVLNLSGWYDSAYGPEGAVTNHLGLEAARRGREPRTRLVLGPWIHGVATMNARDGQVKAGDRIFGPAAALDYDGLILRFMDRYLRGIDNGIDREKPIRVFVLGENAWRDEEAWPPASARERTLYLRATGEGQAGALSDAPPEAASSSSVVLSDPRDPVTDPFALQAGGHDYRGLVTRKDVLVFETAPLPEDLRVLGPLRARMHVSADARDTDLWVRLFDVEPGGTAWNLTSPGLDVLRASYRDGGPERKLLEPGRVYELRFDNLLAGNLFRKGHRLRLLVSTAFFPHYSRNLHTGELEMDSKETRRAEVCLHHDAEHPSSLTLSVVP